MPSFAVMQLVFAHIYVHFKIGVDWWPKYTNEDFAERLAAQNEATIKRVVSSVRDKMIHLRRNYLEEFGPC